MKYTTFEKLEQELASRDAEIESMRQQLDGWIAANSPNGWIDNLRQQLVTLKTEIKSIGEAIDDPRTDLTMTMSEIIIELKQQLAASQKQATLLLYALEGATQIITFEGVPYYLLDIEERDAALEACKAKDDIILEVLECESTTRPPIRLREALAIQPDDSALKT